MITLSIKNNQDINNHINYINQFEPLYNSSFPDDEREPYPNIINRIKNTSNPITSMKLVVDENICAGGIIMDYYPQCNSIEPVYMTILPQYRNKGIGKSLLNSVDKEYPNIQHVFFETDNPELVPPEQSAINPTQRLNMWLKWNYQIIPINYIQPPLDKNKNYEFNLLLLHKGIPLTKNSLSSFLIEFYKGLNQPQNNQYLQNMLNQINDIL